MAKDPAFLFYSQDFYTGVATMSFEDRGKYISILCLMHQQGRLNEETIRFLVGTVSDTLKSKFSIDEKGLWFNKRLEDESKKREAFTKSRRDNGNLGGRPKKQKPIGSSQDTHMENDNINEDESRNTDKGGAGGSQIVPQMLSVFTGRLKNYAAKQGLDFRPLYEISQFIAEQKKLPGSPSNHIDQILPVWEKVVNWIGDDAFYSQKSLKTISTHIQEIYQKTFNGTHPKSSNRNFKGGGQLASAAVIESGKSFSESL